MFRSLVLLFAILAVSSAHADEASVKKILQENYSQLGTVDKVSKSDILGLYEVVTDGRLFYTDEKAQYLITGSIYDLKTMNNLTEARARVLLAVDFNSLPLELAVKRVKGDGKRKMAYFADPNCGYCKKLEEEMTQMDNVTLYRFMFPIFEGSDVMVRNILCSKNPSKTWEDWMVKGVRPASGSCASSARTDKVVALGKKMNVTGTPTLIFASGLVVPGYVPVAELEKNLDNTAGD